MNKKYIELKKDIYSFYKKYKKLYKKKFFFLIIFFKYFLNQSDQDIH